MRWLPVLAVSLLLACAKGAEGPQGLNGSPGSPGQSVTSTTLAAGDSHCPNGGTSFTSSSGTSYACNGADGTAAPAVTVSSLPVDDAHCPLGGTSFTVGSQTSYACNGQVGGPGQSVTITALQSGDANCQNGGSSFTVGGTTTYACNGVISQIPVTSPLTGFGTQAQPLGLLTRDGLTLTGAGELAVNFPPTSVTNGFSVLAARADHSHPAQIPIALADFNKPLTTASYGTTTLNAFAVPTSGSAWGQVFLPRYLPPGGSPATLVLTLAGNVSGAVLHVFSTGANYGTAPATIVDNAQAVTVATGALTQVSVSLNTNGVNGPGDLIIFGLQSDTAGLLVTAARVDF